MSKLTDPKSACLLAWIGAIFAPLALIALIGWPWLQQVSALGQEIESLEDRMVRYQQLLKTLPGLEAELAQVLSNKDVEDFFFNAKTPALAGAELQNQMQQMVNSAGGRVTSTQLLPSPEDEQPPKVRVRTQIQGTTDVLLEVLYQIEKARPFLFVDKLSVRAPAQRRYAGSDPRARERRRAVRTRPEQNFLTVRLDVFGYASGGRHP